MSASRDIHNNLKLSASLTPQAVGVETVEGTGVAQKGYGATEHVLSCASAGVGTVSIEESDVLGSGYTTAGADDVLGSQGAAIVQDGTVKLGYVGNKAFSRLSVTMGTGDDVSAVAIQGYAEIATVN